MLKDKVLKRLLPILLSIAMVVTSMPMDAMAAGDTAMEVVTDLQESADIDIAASGTQTGTGDGEEEGEAAEIIIQYLSASYYNSETGNYDYFTVVDDYDEKSVTTTYDETIDNPFRAVVEQIKDAYDDMVLISTEETYQNIGLKEQLQTKWQVKGADGTYTDMAAGEVPVAAGEYKLVLSIDKKYAVAEPVSIDFIIEKAQLYVAYSGDFNRVMKSGAVVKDVKESLGTAFGIKKGENGAINEWYKQYVTEPVVTIKETFGSEALADDFVMKLGGDYTIYVDVALKEAYQANYELISLEPIDIKISELKGTTVTITNNVLTAGSDIMRTYTGEEVAAPVMDGENPEITVVVTSDDEVDETTGEPKVITPAEGSIVKTWLDANGVELESAPVDAGAYYYQVTYTDAEGIYEESSDKIRVIVEPAELVVKPVYSTTDKVFTGSSVNRVLENVTYGLYSVAEDGTETAFTDYDEETFWGVSYNNPSYPQSYMPVFNLQQGITYGTGDGEDATTTWSDVTGDIHYASGATKIGDQDATISYRVVFSGKKALYKDGVKSGEIDVNFEDVNSAEQNYTINTSVREDAKYVVGVEVMASANATIDVTEMLLDGKGDSVNNIYTKIYDGEQLYADRKEYKKASVKDAEGKEIASDTDGTLTYTWYNYYLVDKLDEKGEVVLDENGNPVKEAVLSGTVGTNYTVLPSYAGQYCLKVSYYDPNNEYVAQPAYVYFEIEKQLVKVVPVAEPAVYSDTTVRNFISMNSYNWDHKLYMVPGNDLSLKNDQLVEMTELMAQNEEAWGAYYTLDWTVLVGDSTKPEEAVFTEIEDEYYTEFNKDLLYKLGAKVTFKYSYMYSDSYTYYANFTNNYEVVEEEATVTKAYYDTVDITVKEMGDIELEVRVDESKLETNEKIYDGTGFDLTKAVEAGYITVVKAGTDEVVPIIGENAINLQFVWSSYNDYYGMTDSDSGIVSPKNARTYNLSVSFAGDDTYSPMYEEIGEFVIQERELVITPFINEVVTAGIHTGYKDNREQIVDEYRTTVTGYIQEDAEAFGNGIVAYASVLYEDDILIETKENPGYDYNNYLRYGKDYRAEYFVDFYYYDEEIDALRISWSNWNKYADNYDFIFNSVEFTPNRRGNSSVESVYYTNLKAVYAEGAVTVTPLDGVPYITGATDFYGNELEAGNYFYFMITAPDEFRVEGYAANFDKFIYRNNIEAAGGYVVSENQDMGQIIVAVRADAKDTKNFAIRWEDGYVENYTVDMTKADLLADLTSAVAPKKLAFNGVNRKMTVGETQELDVKVTKNLNTDLVYLNYEVVTGADVVSITQNTGVVTALKKGSATVAVYPVRQNEDGEFERIDGFKQVTTKLTVSDVSAPKIGSVSAYDDSVTVKYAKPADGYRREIYILPGKNVKAAEFETKIAAMGKGSFEGIMTYAVNEATDEKGIVTRNIMGLEANKDYTVYVRNVSGIRTLDDGSEAVASYNGSTKSFKTTKVQIDSLSINFDEASWSKVLYNQENARYEVKLSDKSLKLVTRGWYQYKPSETAADYSDGIWLTLPLTKTEQATYLNPKVNYALLDGTDFEWEKTKEYTVEIFGRYYKPSKIATVDKKGNIKLKGVGKVYLVAWDKVSGCNDWWGEFNIISDVTKVTAKKQTLKTGSAIDVYDKLTFYNGKSKLKVSENFKEDCPLIITSSDYDAVSVMDDLLVAVAPNKTATITVTLANNPSVSTTMQVQTKAMDAVKKLKVTDIVDYGATVTFTHTANANNMVYGNYADMTFKVTLRDAKGNLMMSEIQYLSPDIEKSNPDKSVFAYETYLYGLDRQCSYTVSVTPVFNGFEAKEAKKKFKTTNIPASYYDLADDVYDAGMSIYVTERYNYLSDVGYLTSGNTYTLIAGANSTARDRKSDTLTWKSSNPKVASIKANNGTYTATLKAAKVGSTVIEVKSKVTKKVIARWIVRIKSVGNAGEGQYGNYEPTDFLTWDVEYDRGVEVLTEVNPVRFTAENGTYDYRWISFTAPADGIYRFGASGGYLSNRYYMNETAHYGTYNVELEEDQTIYLQASGSGDMGWRTTVVVSATTVEKYGKATIGQGVRSEEYDSIRFTAPADNYYTFSATLPNKTATYNGNTINFYNENNAEAYKTNNGIGLSKGETVTLSLNDTNSVYEVTVKGRSAATLTDTATATGELKAGEERWYTFTAPVAGNYTFKSTKATGMLKADYYDSIMDAEMVRTLAQIQNSETLEDTNDFSESLTLDKDETVVLRVYTESETAVTAEISVSQPTVQEVSITDTAAKVVSVAKDGEAWISFVVPEDDTEYTFEYKAEEGKNYNITATYYKDTVNDRIYTYNDKIHGYKAGTVIYVKLTTDTVDDAANVSVSVKATTTTVLTEGTAQALTVEDGGMYFFTFTAPSYGLYTIQSKVATDEGTKHVLTAADYSAANADSYVGPYWDAKGTYDFYEERKLYEGEQVIFAVTATTATDAKTAAEIIVNKVTPTTLPTEAVTLKSAEAVWYKYTATSDDTYKFEWNEDSTASVYYSSTLNAYIGNVMTSGNTLELSEGDTVYFKVNNGTAAETSIKFNVTSATPLLPTAAFTVKAGTAYSYKYIVSKATRYKVTYSAAEEGANVYVDWTYSYNSGSLTSGDELILDEVGKAVTFTIYSDVDATVTMKVEKIVPTAYSENAITVKTGDATWVEYTVPATGRYSVALTSADGKETNVTAQYDTNIMSEYMSDISYMNEKWFTKGMTYYIRLDNATTEDASVKLSIKKIEATELTVGAEATKISLNEGETKWYSVTAAEEGWYTFTAETPENVTMSYYLNDSNYLYTLGSWTEKLAKNTNYLIKVTRSTDGVEGAKEAKLGVVKEEVLQLEEGKDLTITAATGKTTYVTFKAPKAAYYGIRLKDIPEDVTVSVGGDLYLSNNTIYAADSFDIAEEKDFYVMLTFASEKETDTKSVKLSVEKIVPTVMTDALDITVDKSVRAWFEFEAPEDGRYTFDDDSKAVNVMYSSYYGDISEYAYDSGSFPVEYPMEKGQKFVFAVYYDSAAATETEVPANATFKVSVKKVEPIVVTGDSAKNQVAADTETWFAYTAQDIADYTFTFKEVTGGTGDGEDGTGDGEDALATDFESVYLYEDIIDYSYSEYGATISIVLPAGKTVYFKVVNASEESKNIKMNVAKEVYESCTEGVAKEVTFTEYGEKWLAFTAPSYGTYSIQRTDGENNVSSVQYCEEIDGGYSFVYNNNYSTTTLEAGQTIFIKVIGSEGTSTSILIENTVVHKGNMLIGVTYHVDVKTGGKWLYTFTAPTTATYKFYSDNKTSGDPYGELYDPNNLNGSRLNYNDDGNGDNNFIITHYLEAGETVVLSARGWSNNAAAYDVHVDYAY